MNLYLAVIVVIHGKCKKIRIFMGMGNVFYLHLIIPNSFVIILGQKKINILCIRIRMV